eukprot:Gregarina_sp_Poly_1__3537@NODE_2032_length_2809_cov_14_548869_g1169_i2_p3_GENE_NODE_2032_length_2809_cov_14_548869_g1169_i2NODE_2032_length_2809_cov_14_548869_g1169_i2_p3_ORF_typecomplete_len109_score14_43DUF3482/PF11981_8/0_017ImcFrelated_N/PF14331_6/0_15_NODE_2032_length_2809_cov_14_548869_g1169_i2498824
MGMVGRFAEIAHAQGMPVDEINRKIANWVNAATQQTITRINESTRIDEMQPKPLTAAFQSKLRTFTKVCSSALEDLFKASSEAMRIRGDSSWNKQIESEIYLPRQSGD